MILSEKVDVAINSINIKEYSKLFNDVKMKDVITLEPLQLMKGSHVVILTSCDICGKEKEMEYRTYYKITSGCTEKYYCQRCSREKMEKTNLERYGFIHPHRSQKIKDKTVRTNLERYGIDHPSKLDICKDKQKKTNIEKYGVTTILQNKKIVREGLLKKYGTDSPIKNEKIKEKIEKTNLERYGVKNPWQNTKIRDKIKKTNLEKYGYDTPTKSKDILNKIKVTNTINFIEKYKNYGIINYDIDEKIITMRCDNGHLFEINYTTFINRIKLKTKICTICYPVSSYSNSGYELQLQDFIKNNYKGEILMNSRKIIGRELDVYLPYLKLSFEFNGLFWHSDYNINNTYHLEKTELAEKNNINLIHIYEDDWVYKQDIVKSRILNLLGKSDKIMARKCEIKEINDNNLIRKFLDKNHLQGFIGSKFKIGLFYNNELVSLMTFGNLRNSMGQKSLDGTYEMLRFCNKLNNNVVGGASRLFNYFINNYDFNKIISYADRSWSIGNLYEKLGFELIHKTNPNYYYVVGDKRFYRFGFRKDKLIKEGYDPNKTEHEIMLERKIYRIYDSGNLKYQFMKSPV